MPVVAAVAASLLVHVPVAITMHRMDLADRSNIDTCTMAALHWDLNHYDVFSSNCF